MVGVRGAIARGETSAAEQAERALARIRETQPDINAFIEVFDERALAQARAVDARLAAGESVDSIGPLAGVPVSVKDNICLEYGRTTCGSRMLSEYRSPFSATAACRLIEAGAVVVGKANMDEYAMGGSSETSYFGAVKNPWDTGRVAGGSSGGSAAGVAAGVCPVSLGSDTGGSVRQPASFCGVVGFKPTYGRISRYGLVAFASSLDQIGIVTRSVEDAAIVGGVVFGQDENDATSSREPVPDLVGGLGGGLGGAGVLRVGVLRVPDDAPMRVGGREAMESAARALRDSGVELVDVELPNLDAGVATYYIVATAEASSNMARYDGVRYGHRAEIGEGGTLEDLYTRSRGEGFGSETKRRIMLGTHALSSGYYDAYYNTALKARRRIKEDFDAALGGGVDAVLMPATSGVAFGVGELRDPLSMYLEDTFTVGPSLAGLPAISVPATWAEVGGKQLPCGVQLVGGAMDEAGLMRVARVLEEGLGLGAREAGV